MLKLAYDIHQCYCDSELAVTRYEIAHFRRTAKIFRYGPDIA
jgi:hypothetical protein